jgi:hypothetical protein
LRTALEAVREQLFGIGFVTFFCLGAFLLYSILYATRLTPRFIAVWGLIGVVAAFAWNVLKTLGGGEGRNATMILALPIIANEIFLGIWLIVKSYDEVPAAAEAAGGDTADIGWESRAETIRAGGLA